MPAPPSSQGAASGSRRHLRGSRKATLQSPSALCWALQMGPCRWSVWQEVQEAVAVPSAVGEVGLGLPRRLRR